MLQELRVVYMYVQITETIIMHVDAVEVLD